MFDIHDSDASNGRVVIDLRDGGATLDVEHADVEVNDEIEFEVRGRIEGVEEGVLDRLSGRSLVPAEIHFCTEEDTD